MSRATVFLRGFSDELCKLAGEAPNFRPPASAPAVPVQRIPSGSSPAPSAPSRPALPTAPTYKPAEPPAAAAPKGGGGGKPVGTSWLQMADRAPTESTSRYVSRGYGVPEYQMGINQGKPVSGRADDPLSPTVVTQPRGGAPGIPPSGRPTAQAKPLAGTEAQQRVPQYLQQSVGGFVTPKLRTPYWHGLPDPNYWKHDAARPASAPTTQQPAQAAL